MLLPYLRLLFALPPLAALVVVQGVSSSPAASLADIQHVVVLMQENRSFDHYFGKLKEYDPTLDVEALPAGYTNPNPSGGPPVRPFHKTILCEAEDVEHGWVASHEQWNNGANDRFTFSNAVPIDPSGRRSLGYYTQDELPYYYKLYSTFAIGDRYFQSLLGPTYPNRFYLLAGSSYIDTDDQRSAEPGIQLYGETSNRMPMAVDDFKGTSIFNSLDAAGITWKVYGSQPVLTFANEFAFARNHIPPLVVNISQYFADAAAGTLPQVAFVDPIFVASKNVQSDEHPPANVQVGQKFVHDVIDALFQSPNWTSSALFLTYDEHGGYADHVPPPSAPLPSPDPANPAQDLHGPSAANPDHLQYGTFDRYGFRVPVAVVSPFAKQHFVSHVTHDHTSVLHFIENRFGLPALTNRTALADPMLEFFDFANPPFMSPPALPVPPVDLNRPECEQTPPDGDLDGAPDPWDSCPTQANADQADYDADGQGDMCDVDDDGDGSGDADEAACGGANFNHLVRPERVDGPFAGVDDDGDTAVDEPLPAGSTAFDCDGDGYKGSAEDHVYSYKPSLTGNQKTCQEYDSTFPNPAPHVRPSLRWPADVATGAFSGNAINVQDLATFIVPLHYVNTDVGTNPSDVRFDLAPGSAIGKDITIVDMATLIASTSGYPPMLGGKRAFGGPVCPWPP